MSKESREIKSPVQLNGSRKDAEGNRTPVKFFGPKGAPAPKPAKRQARQTGKKALKSSSTQTTPSASTAEGSSPEPQSPQVTPTQIPESDS